VPNLQFGELPDLPAPTVSLALRIGKNFVKSHRRQIMSYDFKDAGEVLENFGLNFRFDKFVDFKKVQEVETESWFQEVIDFSLSNRGVDDKEFFTSEFIIVPFLREIWRRHPNLSLFSHVQIRDGEWILIPDYLVSSRNPTGFKKLHKPLLLTVEAKNEKFEEGWLQALLQSVVCRKINGTDEIPIFSVVTTGDIWQFGKLETATFIRHPVPASVQDTERLLGILDELFSECERNLWKIGHGD
jgi:hypothetical protein